MIQSLFRVSVADAPPRLARGTIEEGPRELLGEDVRLDRLLAQGGSALGEALADGVREHDASGREQPIEAEWNRGGFANNTAQRITVLVT